MPKESVPKEFSRRSSLRFQRLRRKANELRISRREFSKWAQTVRRSRTGSYFVNAVLWPAFPNALGTRAPPSGGGSAGILRNLLRRGIPQKDRAASVGRQAAQLGGCQRRARGFSKRFQLGVLRLPQLSTRR